MAERADAEARIHGTRTSSDQTADAEYARARQGLTEKLERLNREAVAEDEKQRRAIVDAAIDGEAKAKAEFAAGSRKIATHVRRRSRLCQERIWHRQDRGRREPTTPARRRPPRKNAEKTKPIEDSAGLADRIA